MSFRYIGSKARLVDQLGEFIGKPYSKESYFIDAFCGTGSVAEAAAELGWNIRINDILYSAVITSEARLMSIHQVSFENLGGYDKAIEKLNAVVLEPGFVWRAYSPASLKFYGVERKYFSEENAIKIDSVRRQIKEWRDASTISHTEERLLIADLLKALNRIANIAGTFGCFLSKWTPQSKGYLKLECRKLKNYNIKIDVSIGDVFSVKNKAYDLVYLDPPYTKRQYASYYHILETIAFGDEPIIEGVSGLRPWKDKASAFCYKRKALITLSNLVSEIQAKKVLVSYSNDGHIKMDEMIAAFNNLGMVKVSSLGEINRYEPNKKPLKSISNVNEFLVEIEK
ncbi:DNA adenine methylase [Klebsiella pneumoniae]|uniref:site-specific DNA-methyltransferase (adenine-specific) n=1 Tax=Citrobacter freundii TaxID=546 RepID=A0AAP9QFK0_CITFR|nr:MULTISPECIES: DNA adenine methylase [Enterobacteriaceae]EAM6500229.1 DNA methyltransferase [Salmonella enterica]EBX5391635.1 DNA methyltransferase [Salmonella enterica subsp. enterica serovar Newport]EAN3276387.1 DNA methyltransferase [Salmonella enterica subsp. enterica serovar Oranienburg]EAO0497932.1 DNA methyltransferase [Salmonella enterica]EAO4479325.1 DNA methyltransferase [Salmonella enterica]